MTGGANVPQPAKREAAASKIAQLNVRRFTEHSSRQLIILTILPDSGKYSQTFTKAHYRKSETDIVGESLSSSAEHASHSVMTRRANARLMRPAQILRKPVALSELRSLGVAEVI